MTECIKCISLTVNSAVGVEAALTPPYQIYLENMKRKTLEPSYFMHDVPTTRPPTPKKIPIRVSQTLYPLAYYRSKKLPKTPGNRFLLGVYNP